MNTATFQTISSFIIDIFITQLRNVDAIAYNILAKTKSKELSFRILEIIIEIYTKNSENTKIPKENNSYVVFSLLPSPKNNKHDNARTNINKITNFFINLCIF